jgi:sugar (pentulose or hexulose) kinase
VTKLRWLAEHETTNAARVAAVCLPHDWLTSRLLGSHDIDKLVTDRSDASGTGYWSPLSGEYRMDLLRSALGHDAVLPRVLNPSEPAGVIVGGAVVGPGAGDNAAVALGVGARPGDAIISNATPAHIARAAVEGVLCGLADCLDALMLHGARSERLLLVGGAARSPAVRRIAPTVFSEPVMIPRSEEFGAYGAARQAAWTLTSTTKPPAWPVAEARVFHTEAIPSLRARFSLARRSVARHF